MTLGARARSLVVRANEAGFRVEWSSKTSTEEGQLSLRHQIDTQSWSYTDLETQGLELLKEMLADCSGEIERDPLGRSRMYVLVTAQGPSEELLDAIDQEVSRVQDASQHQKD